jgi:hypothetical protein
MGMEMLYGCWIGLGVGYLGIKSVLGEKGEI